MAYATYEDVEARIGRELTETEQQTCEVLLDDAAVMIDAVNANAPDNAKKNRIMPDGYPCAWLRFGCSDWCNTRFHGWLGILPKLDDAERNKRRVVSWKRGQTIAWRVQ